SAWLPRNESGFTLSRKKMAGTVMRWRTIRTARRSRGASSSGARGGRFSPSLAPAPGPGLTPVFDGGFELRFHKRHDPISISSEGKPHAAVRLEPASLLEGAQKDPVPVEGRAPHFGPRPRPHDPERPHLDRVGREPVLGFRNEGADRSKHKERGRHPQDPVAGPVRDHNPEHDKRGQQHGRRPRFLPRRPDGPFERTRRARGDAPPRLRHPRPRGPATSASASAPRAPRPNA